MNDFIKSTPTLGGGIGGGLGSGIGWLVKTVVKAVKSIFDIFKGTSKEASETDSINDNSSLENIERIIQIFSAFKEQVHVRAVEVENAVMEEVDYYVDELRDLLNDNTDKVDKYGIRIKRIEKQIDKISRKVKGVIDSELSKKISLDNSECKEIVKMIPGAKKEAAMNDFLNSAVKDALDICCTEIHSSIDEIYDDVESEIIGAVDAIQRQSEDLKDRYALIDENNYEVMAKAQLTDAYYLSDVCDIVNEML